MTEKTIRTDSTARLACVVSDTINETVDGISEVSVRGDVRAILGTEFEDEVGKVRGDVGGNLLTDTSGTSERDRTKLLGSEESGKVVIIGVDGTDEVLGETSVSKGRLKVLSCL